LPSPQEAEDIPVARKKPRLEEPLSIPADEAASKTASPDISVDLPPPAADDDDVNADTVMDTQPNAGATGRWTLEENAKLTRAVANTSKKKHGKEYRTDWVTIAALFPGRTKIHCYNRWHNCLDPNIDRATGRQGKWTADEEELPEIPGSPGPPPGPPRSPPPHPGVHPGAGQGRIFRFLSGLPFSLSHGLPLDFPPGHPPGPPPGPPYPQHPQHPPHPPKGITSVCTRNLARIQGHHRSTTRRSEDTTVEAIPDSTMSLRPDIHTCHPTEYTLLVHRLHSTVVLRTVLLRFMTFTPMYSIENRG
jgi:hypothetical protein